MSLYSVELCLDWQPLHKPVVITVPGRKPNRRTIVRAAKRAVGWDDRHVEIINYGTELEIYEQNHVNPQSIIVRKVKP